MVQNRKSVLSSDSPNRNKQMLLQSIKQYVDSGKYDDALRDIEALLESDPDNIEGLYLQAVCYRHKRQFRDADTSIIKLKKLRPEYGRAYEEEGHCHVETERWRYALDSYIQACKFNPALIRSWEAVVILSRALKHAELHSSANERLQDLKKLPGELIVVMDHIAEGRLVEARQLCRQFLQTNSTNVEAIRLLADANTRLQLFRDAEELLENARKLEPNRVDLWIGHIQVLGESQKYDQAISQASALLESEPDNTEYMLLYGVQLQNAGRLSRALSIFNCVLDQKADDLNALILRARALGSLGHTEAAVASYRKILECHPGNGEAYYALANLKNNRLSDKEFNEAKKVAGSPNSVSERVYIDFAVGKGYERNAQYGMAMERYRSANNLKKSQNCYSMENAEKEVNEILSVYSASFFEARQNVGYQGSKPIFVLGLPEAGAMHLVQYLGNHSRIKGAIAFPNITSLVKKLHFRDGGSPGYPHVMKQFPENELSILGKSIIDETYIHSSGIPLYVDNALNNFFNVGLIRLVLPNARIIDVRRNPLDCCFSCYKKLYPEGQDFSYSLEGIGRYYRNYIRVMVHWQTIIPDFLLKVDIENLVKGPESELRRVLNFCRFPFQSKCFGTAAPDDVRNRPRFGLSKFGEWIPFEEYLQPLKDELGPELTALSVRA